MSDPRALSGYWLRDNCPCAECRDAGNGQKLFQITDLPADLAVRESTEQDGHLEVLWSDGHRSRYPLARLAADTVDNGDPDDPEGPSAAARHPGDHRTEAAKRFWHAADFAAGIPEAHWDAYLADPAERAAVLRAVRHLGFAVLRGVPTADRQVLAVARSFGHVRVTNYGELFDVRVEPDPNNLAFTSAAITPHTDNPYRDPVPTLQLLHCLENAAEGGDSGLVDGFAAADLLRTEAPEDFALLTRTPVPFVFRDRTTELHAERPLIETDALGRIREIRFNNRSIGTLRLPAADLDAFYAAYRRFAAITLRPELLLAFRLDPGDCLVFDNTRLLHARTAFDRDGRRHLQGCYADLDSLISTLAVLDRHTAALDTLQDLFEGEGAAEYLGEKVTQAEHMLQAAVLAHRDGAPPHLVAAALLHDVGHFHGTVTGSQPMAGTDNRHSHTGADRLARWFGPEVTEPIRLHVAAKRYLCAVEPEYRAGLSEASEYTLQVQGGPMDAEEAAAFAALPGAADAVAVRRWDDLAKTADADTPGFAHFRPLLAGLLAADPGR
ncbi:phosphonate degradation HD-domain oxygenase [Kitasatospora sp. DSM 101779]|uniref:2-trimethylaminoethylphosphonate dioxygenase n=1 Tax=Kitasatospora sp. DSM 101779 TaxID=2853165 RepID=UPI0021DAEDE5|nr:phosphonate degradation HD-domain oxygenase [Kitasatospora sp. DSM 101779]MCU7820615.1 TauD/TfdA family dioxygenase [Kitasatospora sp. DSM 101779]